MKSFWRSFICLILLAPAISFARCLQSPIYAAEVKVEGCDEGDFGAMFIHGTLLRFSEKKSDSIVSKESSPVAGRRYLFFKFYRGADWLTKKQGYCKEIKKGSIIKAVISTPCCDAGYEYCKRPVDFLMEK